MPNSENNPTSKQPAFIAYHIRDGKDKDAFWTKIGAAWAHADGDGYNLVIEMMPLDGRIALRVPKEKK